MQIYMKDNKALIINKEALTPKMFKETWVLNDYISLDLLTAIIPVLSIILYQTEKRLYII